MGNSIIKGAREHILKNLDVEITRDKLVDHRLERVGSQS